MNPGFSPFKESARSINTKNDTARGGRAQKQSSGLRMVLFPLRSSRDAANERDIGKIINMRVLKNSFGCERREIQWELRDEHDDFDREGWLDPVIHFDAMFAKWLAENRYLGVTVTDNLFTLEDMGRNKVSGAELGAAVNASPEMRQRLGEMLCVNGYDRSADKTLEALRADED